MAVTEGEDGKLHYINERKLMRDNMAYESYGHWYDEGPGSEKFKRELRESMRADRIKDFKNWYSEKSKTGKEMEMMRKQRAIRIPWKMYDDKEPDPKEYITDEDLEIDI